MSSEKTTLLHAAARRVLRPLVSIMLRCGMTWREFSELSKATYVQAATEEFGINGRPTNVSRVSILTGISRKEVKRQRDLLATKQPPIKRKTTDATRLLSGWHQDPDFLDGDGSPRLLPADGANPSFGSLFARYGGDMALPTMIKELLKTGAMQRTEDDTFKVLSRYYQPSVTDSENLTFAVDRIYDVVETMKNNMFPEEFDTPRFGGFAANDAIPLTTIPEFNAYLDKRGQAFLEEIDDWLTEHANENPASPTPTARIGIGLFATDERISEE